MITYAFILGRKHLLSIAELCSVLPADAQIIDIRREALIATFPQPLSLPQESLNRLGGTMKIAEVFASPVTLDTATEAVSSYLINKFKDRESKLSYGLSVYNFAQGYERLIKKTLMGVKKELKSEGLKSRFINKNFTNLENAAIKGEKLLEDGAEILLIKGADKIFMAETKALQDFENYSHRDYDRPERDARLGMLPPKLAQIMINLSGLTKLTQPVDTSKTVYDPFSGVGTIPTEALLFGYSVAASDISPEIMQKTEKNLNWTTGRTKTQGQIKLFAKDASTLTKQDLPESPDAVVTETYLGPPLKLFPGTEGMKRNFSHINELLFRFFKALHPLLNKNTPIVFTVPVYRENQQLHFMDNLIERIEQLGYKAEPLIPKNLSVTFNLTSFKRAGLVYDRPDQVVGREVFRLRKT